MFCNIFVYTSLQCPYHMYKAVQSTHCSWTSIMVVGIADTLYTASLYMQVESYTDEHEMSSNSGR